MRVTELVLGEIVGTLMKCEKGIILAGGTGSRLYPLTIASNKQLLPIYDKPVIYYPLTTLMLAGIKDILIISTAKDLPPLKNLLGTGAQWGMRFEYKVQEEPKGLPEAFIIGEEFINGKPVALILGDNFYHGHGLSETVRKAAEDVNGSHLFLYNVEDPSPYGVIILRENGTPVEVLEKPKNLESKLAITGLYYFDGSVAEKAKELKPSERGELEITDLIRFYLLEGKAKTTVLGRGYVWFDVGSATSLLSASNYVETLQSRQGINIASPEEVAWRMEFIDEQKFCSLISVLPKGIYKKRLEKILDGILEIK